MLRLHLGQHLTRVVQAEALEGAVRQHTAPGVKNHHGLRPGLDLGVQVGRHGLGIDGEDALLAKWREVVQGMDMKIERLYFGETRCYPVYPD